jgi:hypothetical protein
MSKKRPLEQTTTHEEEVKSKSTQNHTQKIISDSTSITWSTSLSNSISATPSDSTACDFVVVEEGEVSNPLPGRRSFRNFNSCVEKYYNSAIDASRFKKAYSGSSQSQCAVGDTAMEVDENTYEGLVSLPRGPNQVSFGTTICIVRRWYLHLAIILHYNHISFHC